VGGVGGEEPEKSSEKKTSWNTHAGRLRFSTVKFSKNYLGREKAANLLVRGWGKRDRGAGEKKNSEGK